MSKDEMKMIKEMAMILAQADRECLTKSEDCGNCNAWGKEPCACYNEAEALYNANYRQIADDEIVIKQTDYVELNKDFYDWKKEYDHNCLLRLEVFELEKQLKQAEQETAREILKWMDEPFTDKEIRKLITEKYGIE